ncbi:MAG: hypothetical protein JWM47_3949 [Acidimicrobiales bacterium]|nr:hypothetical protein [Acidimicrobiales bacterium]
MSSSTGHSSELDLRDYLRVLWRRRRVVVLTTLAAVAAAIAASLTQAPTYEATAKLVLGNQSTDPFTTTVVQVNQDRAVQTEIQVFSSRPVIDDVRKLIGAAPAVKVSALGQTNAIAVTARAPEPDQAAEIANAYTRAYIDTSRAQSVADLNAAAVQIQKKVDDLQNQITALDLRPGDPASKVAQRDSLVSQQAVYRQKLDQIQVAIPLQAGGAEVSTPATSPSSPAEPRPVRSAILALAIGLVLGVGTALLLEYLDDSITSKEDFEASLGGLPTLGMIPAVQSWKARGDTMIISQDDPLSPVSEAYRSLRTSVQFLGAGRPTSVIEITSPNPGEGKTTTVVNLAFALASTGQEVCIVDCDLRRPRVHAFFDLSQDVGLSSVITGEISLAKALQPVKTVDGLWVLASGPLPPNPAEILSSRRAHDVFRALADRFDMILIDSPPVLPVTDAAVIAPFVDLVLLVVSAGSTTRRGIERAYELLRQVDAPVAGGVLNGVTAETSRYGYEYGYRYSSYQPTGDAPVEIDANPEPEERDESSYSSAPPE